MKEKTEEAYESTLGVSVPYVFKKKTESPDTHRQAITKATLITNSQENSRDFQPFSNSRAMIDITW